MTEVSGIKFMENGFLISDKAFAENKKPVCFVSKNGEVLSKHV